MDYFRTGLGTIIQEVPMAEIIWRKRPLSLLANYIDNANADYGKSTALKWASEVAAFEERVRLYPTSYSPERLLNGKKNLYRGCHVMNRRFKIIYSYNETKDVVRIFDIWDTRMNPKALIKRIK